MWITASRLWLEAAVLWSMMLHCVTTGLLVDTESTATDFLPVILAQQQSDGQSDRGSQYDSGMIGGPLHDVDEVAETPYDPDDLSCTELRSKRYISDGFCTSAKPITEVVCAGECVPKTLLDWGADIKVWSGHKTKEWRCVNDVVRQRRVHLVCANSERRTYRIRTVKSCKCKRYDKRHNESDIDNTNENANEDRRSREERRRDRKNEKKQSTERSNRRRDREQRSARQSHRADSRIPS